MTLSQYKEGGKRTDDLLAASRRPNLNLCSYFLLLLLPLSASSATAQGFDHEHRAWTALLKQHVVLLDGGKASRVRYADFQKDRAALKAYTDSLSRIAEGEFKAWSRERRLAFLINAYNAHMVELILTRYPRIESVWDFGRLVNNPFKQRFFTLFGRPFTLDMIEHDMIRARGVYDDPRIHMAVNCASLGCPMLREEAYVAERLDRQLEEQVVRFLGDRTRNRYDPAANALEVSEIFRWYASDFTSGLGGIRSREQFFAKHASALADVPADQQVIREEKADIRFLVYDWRLNDVRSMDNKQ